MSLTTIPTGSNTCPNGGQRIDIGVDTNGDGQLDPNEVKQTANVCNGSNASGNPTVDHLLISQIYGGGGNVDAVYTNDFIELHNPTNHSVDLAGFSLQYAAAGSDEWQVSALPSISLPPGGFALVQELTGMSGIGAMLPASDATGLINLHQQTGKVALVASTIALLGTCPTGGDIVDFVGYGVNVLCSETQPTANISNEKAIRRKQNACVDTDVNASDFEVIDPQPRNSLTTVRCQ